MNDIQLKSTFLKYLDENRKEEFYQKFLEENTKLIPREFIQNHGLHFDIVLRKLKFGSDYVSDFFYMSKSSGDWNLVFVEIEKPSSRIFLKGNNDFHSDFVRARSQITQWRAWLDVSSNASSLLENTLAPIFLPEVMRANKRNMKFVLVIGRRSEYQGSELRRRLVAAEEQKDFKILSFDSLVESLHSKHECYIGIRRNQFIDILGDRVLSSDVFGWLEPKNFRVSEAMKESIAEQSTGGFTSRRMVGTELVDSFEYFSENVLIRKEKIC